MSMDWRVGDSPLRLTPRTRRTQPWLAGGLTLTLLLAVGAIHSVMRDEAAAGLDSGAQSNVANSDGQCQPLNIDSAGLPAGTILGEQFAAQGVHISAVANEGFPDALIIFDSNSTDPDLDADLRVGIGNIAILANNLNDENGDGLVDKPDENNFGGRAIFTFDQPVRIGSFIFVDHDHQPSDYAAAYDASGNLITKVLIPIAGDGSVQTIDVNADGVRRFELVYRDSGGFQGPGVECPPGTPTPTRPVETGTPTPPAETGTPTPPVQTPTPTPGTPTATATPLGATSTPVGTTVAAPTPKPSPQAVAGAISGPSGVPAAGGGSLDTGNTTAKLLITLGMLLSIWGVVAVLGKPRQRV